MISFVFNIAYAQPVSSSGDNLELVLVSLAVIAVAGGLAFVPVTLGRMRHHRQTESLTALAILWTALTAGSVIYLLAARMKWSREQTLRVESGYYDPRDQSDAPRPLVRLWIGAAVYYAGLLAWAASQNNPAPTLPPFARPASSPTNPPASE